MARVMRSMLCWGDTVRTTSARERSWLMRAPLARSTERRCRKAWERVLPPAR